MAKIIAHRGSKENENTIEAFKRAITNPLVDGFELDIRLSKDEKIVVIHDSFVDRVTSITGLVSEYTSFELEKHNIPTLENVLKLATDKIILIEVKDEKIDPRKLLDLLNQHPKKNIYVQSFNSTYIHKLLELNPKQKMGILINLFNQEKSYDEYDFVSLFHLFTNEEEITKFQKKNIEVFLWGVLENTSIIKNKLLKLNDIYLIVDI